MVLSVSFQSFSGGMTPSKVRFQANPKANKATLNELKQDLLRQAQGLGRRLTPQQLQAAFVSLRETTDKVGRQAGFLPPLRVPRMLMPDAYIAASAGYVSPKAKTMSTYQLSFRRELTPWMKQIGLKPEQSRFVFFGLQELIGKLLHDPVTRQEIDEADTFYKTARAGQPFKWDRAMWDRIVDEYDGYIPIKVEALRDGAVSFPGEPVIQITAKDGFGPLAVWFESKLVQLWATSERASLLRFWLDYNKDLVRKCTNQPMAEADVTAKAQKLMVDFSDRSGMTPEESQVLGLASLTSFPATSTVSAAYLAYKRANNNSASTLAMDSLYHGIVQGYDKETDAYDAIFNHARGRIASYVADCYDYRKAVGYLVELAKKAQHTGNIVCARPDSGDPYEQILFALNKAVEAGLYTTVTAADGRPLKAMTTLRVIQADGMTLPKVMEINEKLIQAGFSPPDCVYYGVGGYLHDALSRSNMSAAAKLAAYGDPEQDAMKAPLDAPGKESIPGRVKIVRTPDGQPSVRSVREKGQNELVVWYDGINRQHLLYREDFRDVQKRVLNEFHTYPRPKQLLSAAVLAKTEALKTKYRNATYGAQA